MLKCIKEDPTLHMFKDGETYYDVYNSPVLTVHSGIFTLELTFDKVQQCWMNPKEKVQFLYVGENEHY